MVRCNPHLGLKSRIDLRNGLDTAAPRPHAYSDLADKTTTDGSPEKRATRRFALRLPVSVSDSENDSDLKAAQTRDVSARGICFYVESNIAVGAGIEFTFTLPPEITLTESIRVRCKGKVVRVDNGSENHKVAVAAVIDEYEFLSGPQ
ncbi:MAG: PilZ domain-containing protein [Terriglobales bacterium]|jgi:hypothetical protein